MFRRFMRGSRSAAAAVCNSKAECEKRLLDLMDEAYRIFRDCYPDAYNLSMFATNDGCCAMGYKVESDNRVLLIDAYKNPKGVYWHSDKEVDDGNAV